jgi:hypothetical protein
MPRPLRCTFVVLLFMSMLTACRFDHGSNAGPARTTDASAVATLSTQGTVFVTTGGSKQVSITFRSNSSDELVDLEVTTGLASLPAGWSGPGSFKCASVTQGSGCALNLSYAPARPGQGTLIIDYQYKTSAGLLKTGSQSILYASGADNDVAAVVSPGGRINAVVGDGSMPVIVNFSANDGNPVTELELTTSLKTLPMGWSSPLDSFACETVSVGDSCQLPLLYQPQAGGGGTLRLEYSFRDNAGAQKSGSLDVPYAATTHNNAVPTVSPSNTVSAVVGGGRQTIGIYFTTDDGNAATNLRLTTPLQSLPAGWNGDLTGFSCSTFDMGNGCVLSLSYEPAAAASGTLTLDYSYQDNSGAEKNGSVAIAFAWTTRNNAVSMVSPGGPVTAVIGAGSRHVNIYFTSDDGNTLSELTMATDLSALPSGWSSTVNHFTCEAVSTGNGCVLPLSFTPAAPGTGLVTLTYHYKNNTGEAKSGSLNIQYSATTNNNVLAIAAPSGPVNAVVGEGHRDVAIQFVSDDGNSATDLVVTAGLDNLPLDWSSAAAEFSCATVGTGNGCQLLLAYEPTDTGCGSVVLSYGYHDNSGSDKTGSLTVPYCSTIHNNAHAVVSPSAILARVGEPQGVQVYFNSDDGRALQQVTMLPDPGSLPSGWSTSQTGFACEAVSTGNGCVLALTFTPASIGTGTWTLVYHYVDNAGAQRTGSVDLSYSVTADNLAIPEVSPAGTIAVKAVDGSMDLSVAFESSDGNPVYNLIIDASTLPAGWTSNRGAEIRCPEVATRADCTFSFNYAPPTYDVGTVSLPYIYRNNAGITKSGTITIPYRATTDNNVLATADKTSVNLYKGEGTTVQVTFATDDGYPASDLQISGLTSLPAGWHPSGNFSCASVSAGGACALALYYAPEQRDDGIVTLSYSYTDNSGAPKAGTLSLPYTAQLNIAYIGNTASNTVVYCDIASPGYFYSSTCQQTGSSFAGPAGIALHGAHAYITNRSGNSVTHCSVDIRRGGLSSCTVADVVLTEPYDIAINAAGTLVYIADNSANGLTMCSIGSEGALTDCHSLSAFGGSPSFGVAASPTGEDFYVGSSSGLIATCRPVLHGITCDIASSPYNIRPAQAVGNKLYGVVTGVGVVRCTIAGEGMALTFCGTAKNDTTVRDFAVAPARNQAIYIGTSSGSPVVWNCPLSATGGISGSCAYGSTYVLTDPQTLTIQ